MVAINSRHIYLYTKCPKLCRFEWRSKKEVPVKQKVIEDVIKSAYLYYIRNECPAPWGRVLSWTERSMVANTEMPESPERYRVSKGYLKTMFKWYHEHYRVKINEPGLTNVPVNIRPCNNLTFSDSIDIVSIGEEIRLLDFLLLENEQILSRYSGRQVYNDIIVLSKVWAFWRASDVMPSKYTRILIGAESMDSVTISITSKYLKKAEGIIRQVMNGVRSGVYYPSYSEQCHHCIHSEHCHI